MNAAVLATNLEPVPALTMLQTHSGPVLLDFDETVYLRNSTEDFIDSARPALLALLVLRVLDAIRPWRFTGGDSTRDVWRVRCIAMLFPWTKSHWPKRAQALAQFANVSLIKAVQRRTAVPNHQPVIIATLGFDFIVAPLACALGLPDIRIIASRPDRFTDRAEGKLRRVVSVIGNEAVRRSLVLTDSRQDDPLLDACAVPLHVEWPEARFKPAFSDRYLPGQYIGAVKRPGERFIARAVLQEDFVLWVLASVALATQPLAHVGGLLCLLLSFWAVYESGYVDNDLIAARYERDPKLTGAFREAQVATPRIAPWIWALIAGAAGVWLLRGWSRSALIGFGVWTAVLVATYGAFALYNRFDKRTRIWWYCGLQFARSAAFVALVPIQLVGALAIAAHVFAKWVPYYLYRISGKNWPAQSHFLPRLLFFALLCALVAVAAGWSAVVNWTCGALLVWNVYRARQELMSAVLDATRLDRAHDRATQPAQPAQIDALERHSRSRS
jgi:hypothetical protein